MNISQNGLEFIKKYEGFQSKPYICPAGKLTIGYGHVISPHEQFNTTITEKDADRIFLNDLKITDTTIVKAVNAPLTQGQYDALVSLVYNWGGSSFRASTGLKKLNALDYSRAAFEFFDPKQGVVRVRGKIMRGLVNRRQAELRLWNA